jgi:predicted transcriptional regulator
MSPKEYRSKARIYVDILATIMRSGGKTGPTRILYGANLSYDRLMRHLSHLIEVGLVAEEKLEDKTLYKLTDRGREFLLEFTRMQKFAEAFGITI